MLGTLEKDGIIYRKTAEEDSRVTKVFLTEKGYQLKQPVEQMWKDYEKTLHANLLSEEQLLLRKL